MRLKYFKRHVAQWIEHQIPTLKGEGSIPFMLIVFFDLDCKIILFFKEVSFGTDLVSTFNIC